MHLQNIKMSIVGKRKIWFAVSGSLVIASIVAIAFLGIRLGIDFTGGSLLEVDLDNAADTQVVQQQISDLGFESVRVQKTDENGLLIRTESLTEDEHQTVLRTLEENYEGVEEMRFNSIGPVIGQELQKNSLIAIVVTLILIGLYIAWAFREVSEPVASWKYGLLTILTAFHDVLITVGVFAVLGYLYDWQVGTAFVAAALTILGYSINDTVVVFDRTRENLARGIRSAFDETVDTSIKQTFRRSLYTSVTTLLALFAIFLFGGDTTKPFALALIVGISVGTYSSLFLASPALVQWRLLQKKG